MTRAGVRILPFGDAAILVEVEHGDVTARARRSRALSQMLERALGGIAGWERPVPGVGGVLVPFDPHALDPARARDALEAVVEPRSPPDALPLPGRAVDITVRYGGSEGPDLDAVAASLGRSTADVIALHADHEYDVLVLGFLPGFAYLGPLAAPLASIPRRPVPRPRVAPGSVGIAAGMTAVYPSASPAGWHVIGRTDAVLWHPEREPPNLLTPGDRVRFVARGG